MQTEALSTIDPNRVEAILREALAGDETSGIRVAGVINSYQLSPKALAKHRAEIVGMLELLPDDFMDNGGGGWSFLNLCTTKDGTLWTGLHQTCEQLVSLAYGLGLANYMFPREMWAALPGGLPYVAFKRSAFHALAEADQ